MEKRASRNHELPGEQNPGQTHLFLAEASKSAQAPTLEMSKHIEEMLFEWNATWTDYPREQCLAELFEQQAEATPDAIALVAEEQQLTYVELNRHANRLAHTLQAMGVGPECIVGVCLPRSIEMIIGVLAILKAGGAYLPLDPSSPTERLAFMLTDAQAQLLLTHSSLHSRFADFPLQVISLDGRRADATLFTSQDNPSHRVGPEHLAYVIYTSGSTGAPKGVCVSQRNVVRLVLHTNYARLSADEVFLQLAPLSFDASTFELWAPLLNGARLVLAPPTTLSLHELAELLARFHITTLWLTAGLFHQMVEQHLPGLMQLEQLLAGGEALSLSHVQQVLAQPQGPTLINGYGPTEGTTFSCCYPLQVGCNQLEGSSVPIGRPIANTQVYVLDAQGNPVPPGVIGELYIGGDGLARGYLHRPELTAERFVPHPFVGTSRDESSSHDQSGSYSASSSCEPGARLYRTGDLVRTSPEGLIEFVGRADRQIKLRGFRIELGEIEAVLSQHPSIQQALVLLREERPADQRLVAYVIATPGQPCDEDELRHHLKQRLPDYMLPSAFVRLDAFPLTRNGKIDQHALPAPEQVSNKAARLVLPRTPLEELLLSIWAKVLGISHLGIQQNFFELGGHSLLATQVISQLRSTLGVELPLRTLFDAPTIELLAQQIEAVRRTPSQHLVPPLQAAKRDPDAAVPLSAAQQRLWFLQQLAPGSPFYNIADVWRLQGALRVSALAESLSLLVSRHESLRTIFQLINDRLVQLILPNLKLSLPVVDLSGLSTKEQEVQSQRVRQQFARHRFELSRGPLLVACLLRLDKEEHLLLLTLHHIITDGWSMTILLRELAHGYEAALAGTQPNWPSLPLQYTDYALWQSQWLTEETLAYQLACWRQLLEGFPPLLALPTDHPRPAVQSYRGKTHTFVLPLELTQALIELGYREGTTLFMTLLAAFGIVLARLSGQEQLLIGTPIANRTQQQVEDIVGFFVNTLPFPLDLSGRPSFRHLLARVRQVALDTYAHQDVPFERLVEELQPERSLSYAPLCQVFFALQNQRAEALHIPGVRLEPLLQESGTAKFDLLLELINERDGLLGRLEYSQDLFEPETIQRLAERFQLLLLEVLAHPEQDITRLSLLTETERFFLLEKWPDTRTCYPRESNLAELFERQVQHRPEAIALVSQEQHLTYAELNRQANRLAHSLQARGVGPEIIVGLCLERFFEMMIALLAILKVGGAYLPLDPSSPTDRLTFMLSDAQAKLLLTQLSLRTRFTSLPAEVICLDQWFGEGVSSAYEDNPVSRSSAEHLAYVIYTSGSTGIPKGVAVTHRGVLRLVCNTNYIVLGPMHRIAQVSNPSFDAITFEVWGALLHGGQVIEITKEIALSPRVLAQTLYQERITAMFLTTALFNQVAREEATAFGSLSYLLFGGEAVDPQWVRVVLQQGKPEHLLHVYGPTESTTFATWYEVSEVGEQATTVPIGIALANTQTFVLDKAWNLTPVGVVGELYLAGDGLARCYLHRPELTAERFVPHPWGAQPGERLYKTGDLVRSSREGLIEFVGRADRQIKLRGFRIELGEIEAVLSQHPSIQQALVLLREDRPADQRLVAYVIAAPGQPCHEDELRHHLKQRLPDYMLPSAFIWLDAFPLNPNGKVERSALPAPQQTNDSAEMLVLPRTPLEELLVTIWTRVLGSDQVGVQQNFFELGGHSLLATQVISRVRSSLGIELPVRTLFDAPTIEQFARKIETLLWNRQHTASLPLQATKRDPDAALPLSAAQQRLWFLQQLAPGSPFYNVADVWHLQGSLQVPALARSLNLLLARHESLRTIFQLTNDRPVQVILPTWLLELPVIDLSLLPADQRERQSLLLRQQFARHRFELSRGPLLVACLLRLDKEEHLLLLTLHHIITDGWSMGILLRELTHAYEAVLAGTQPSWPPLPLQYTDYALWQSQWLTEETLAHQLSCWHQLLEGFPPLLALPTDHPRPAVQSYRGASHSFILAPELTQKLVELSQNESVTLFMTLLAAFGIVLARLSGQEQLLIGSPIANRTQQQVEDTVGFFVNTLPLPLDLSGWPSFRQLLARVRRVALEAYAHQDVPFERLVEEFQPERSLSYAPLCQVFFSLQNQLMEPKHLPSLLVEPSFQESGTAKFDLTLELTNGQQGLIARLEYSQDLFEPETIERLARRFQLALTQIVAQPEQDIAHIQLLTRDERFLVLEQWNATDKHFEQEQCVHTMIEQQTQRAPDAIALVSQEHHLTYEALNARANQLARYLRRLGVGSETLVGVCLQRSVEMIIGMLAILKAGGAYLPLDPDYPIERIEYMLRDAQVPLLLTTGAFSQGIEQHYSLRVHLVCLEREYEQEQLFQQPSSNLTNVDCLENLAYVIYTSGSTGRPKGVQITHRGLYNLINWHQHNFAVTTQDRATQLASISFDAAVWETWPYLAAGATLCIVEDEMRTMPTTLGDCLVAQQITMCFLPTPLAEMFLDAYAPAASTAHTLRTLLVGGDVLHRASDKELPFVLVNNYGPTENTVVATSGVVLLTRERTGMPTIGYPIANTRLYVLDSLMQPVPIGATGELFIGGSSVARGYLRQPAMTAERFIPDPFVGTRSSASEAGARLYRTGDLVRYRSDGSLDFIGRNDEQVKIRGFRVELGEIEAILRQHESIREAAVIAREDMAGEKRLIAYIVSEPEVPLSLNQPGQYLRDRLPHYMIPARIVTLEQLPLSPNGKLDRRALPALNIDLSDVEKSYVPAHTPVEEALVSIWEKVLEVQRIGIHDNFFELGGHSLLATQVISQMRKAFQVDLPLQTIFDTPTIADLAQSIARMQEESRGASSPQTSSDIQTIPEGKEDAESLLARLDQLSAEEIDALLNARFFERKGER